MAKRSSFGKIVRRRLSDITNSIPQPKSPIIEKMLVQTSDSSAKEYIDHLVKENMALTKLIGDKNKIIELTGKELQNMRIDMQKMQINLQKMQLQNWNLAQSNSHMLAELNLGREKLKVLLHETVSKDALLKAKNAELKENSTMENSQKDFSQKGEEAVVEPISQGNAKGRKTRRGPRRSQSMGPTITSQPVAEKETSENKRRCLRRQSARARSSQEQEPKDLFEIEDTQFLVGPPTDYPICKESLSTFTRKEQKKENCSPKLDNQESQRPSLGRPLRRAAEKVHSYKEIPINVKMRRPV